MGDKGREYERKRSRKGLQRHRNSGAVWNEKGDGVQGNFLVECKYTDGKGYRITKTEFTTHAKYALEQGLNPAFLININGLELLLVEVGYLEYIIQKEAEDV